VGHLWKRIAKTLRELAELLEDRAPGEPVAFVAGWLQRLGEEFDMGEITVSVGDPPQRATVTFFDVDENPTTPDAVPGWSSTDAAVADVGPVADDGLSALVTFVGGGSAAIECSTTETAADGSETMVRATGLVNVRMPDESPDAVTGSIEFAAE
jgi:hypothetical protein